MKCIPITFSGLFVALASFVIEIEEVFVAMIASGFKSRSSSPSTFCLTSRFYTMAYTTKSTFLDLN